MVELRIVRTYYVLYCLYNTVGTTVNNKILQYF